MAKTATIVLAALLINSVASAQTAAVVAQSSSEKVRENPTSQYVLVKTVVGKAIGLVDARALPVEAQGYNLLKYCWTASNVLGDWAERAGLTGDMIVRALETLSWQRDLARAGYPVEPLAQAIGRYEAMLVAAGFTEAARAHALAGFVTDLEAIRRTAPGAAQIHAVERCDGQRRSLGLNYATAPEDGRARFIPYVLHQTCQTQQLDAGDPVRCDYWMDGKTDGPMSFAGETVYFVRWPEGATTTGRFDPEQSRSTGSVTLHQRPQKAN